MLVHVTDTPPDNISLIPVGQKRRNRPPVAAHKHWEKTMLRKPAIAIIAVLASGVGAHASGGFGCDAEDKNVSFLFESGMTRGMGSPVFNFRGTAEIKAEEVAGDLRKTGFDGAHLAQYWSEDGQLNLVIYREREGDKPHGYVQFVIRTKGDEEGYKGRYELTVFDGVDDATPEGKTYSASGKVECILE